MITKQKICLDCNEEICSKRLNVEPSTSLCTSCKSSTEDKRGRYCPPKEAISSSFLFVFNVTPDRSAPNYLRASNDKAED